MKRFISLFWKSSSKAWTSFPLWIKWICFDFFVTLSMWCLVLLQLHHYFLGRDMRNSKNKVHSTTLSFKTFLRSTRTFHLYTSVVRIKASEAVVENKVSIQSKPKLLHIHYSAASSIHISNPVFTIWCTSSLTFYLLKNKKWQTKHQKMHTAKHYTALYYTMASGHLISCMLKVITFKYSSLFRFSVMWCC